MSQHRPGDADIVINGERKILRLTLGALAELEETLGEGDFATLARRFENPRVGDLLVILQALLQGGGALVSLDALKASDLDLAGAAQAIAKAFAGLAPEPSPACGVGPCVRRQGEGASTRTDLPVSAPHPRPLSRARERGEERGES